MKPPHPLAAAKVKLQNYKCFADVNGYDEIKHVNLIVGRNNSGKSALLDLIQILCSNTYRDAPDFRHKTKAPRFFVSTPVDRQSIERVFPANSSGGGVPGRNHLEYGLRWVDAELTRELGPGNSHDFVRLEPDFDRIQASIANGFHKALATTSPWPFESLRFCRLRADRDIQPEQNDAGVKIEEDGRGFTNVLQNYVNKAHLPSDVIEEHLRGELNRIFEPDAKFEDIVLQQLGDGRWEVYLDESDKGRVALTHSGSGIKTILLVLGLLHLLPLIERRPIASYLFGFEELENNLHPALQRRLFAYIRQFAVAKGCSVFLTTHSATAIDLLSTDSEAQIIHVASEKGSSVARTTKTYVDNCGMLDDLDVRASDLLQSNGIVWVEGPSDRIYFNRWMTEFSDGKLEEGRHYQCMFYGGRLLAHLSGDEPVSTLSEAVQLLRINRNAIVLIDSDRTDPDDAINATKARIASEIESVGGLCWITAGRTIENYIPPSALQLLYPTSSVEIARVQQYQDFFDYLEPIIGKEKKKLVRDKVRLAEKVGLHLTRESLVSSLDIETRIEAAMETIRRWNRLPEPV